MACPPPISAMAERWRCAKRLLAVRMIASHDAILLVTFLSGLLLRSVSISILLSAKYFSAPG